ncbi:hypothetical protein CMO92_00105 [Candidatus Woesearchaeota archaeon]|nr:hypothetical protein [Candidatus Woesearchaeota archaeon]|tara:strand:+ start:654 stop:1271 length:618 start_codon:yes stop_codon:yes gene_type:complete
MVKKITILGVLEPFLSTPDEQLHLAHISRALQEPHPTVRQHLNLLEKDGLLKKSHKGRLSLYKLNRDHPLLIDYLVIAEKNRLIRACHKRPVVKELVHFLHENYSDFACCIFGSAVQSFIKANDIDLLVVGNVEKKKLEHFGKKFNKPVHLIQVQNLKAVSRTLKKELEKTHLIVQGSEKFVCWLYGNNQLVSETEERNTFDRNK